MGGLDEKGNKAMVTGVGNIPSNVILQLRVVGFGYALIHRTVHSFLPLEDTG